MKNKLKQFFDWLDDPQSNPTKKLVIQLFPIVVCLILFIVFVTSNYLFIHYLINPIISQKILIELDFIDVGVGFFLYFVTAVDYALIIGRMSVQNPDSRSRLTMNIFTCIGCFVGVTFVLFLWGFAKEISWLIIMLLIFAGSVMIKLAYEGREYFEHSKAIPISLTTSIIWVLKFLYYPTRIFTYWIPELGKPNVKKMTIMNLARWSFVLPFVIGFDDLIGYMGAMNIYNAFGLIFGIYIADILIDILIFVSPVFTKKIVENPFISFLAVFAFLYLAYKSFVESWILAEEKLHLQHEAIIIGLIGFICLMIIFDLIIARVRNHHDARK